MKRFSLICILALTFLFAACGDDGSSSVGGGGSGDKGSEYNPDAGTVKDLRDGQTYATVTIGGRVWMAENLNYETETSVVFPEYDGKSHEKYGRLYAWEDAMDACPRGWRLPGEDDWNDLVAAAGDSATAGTKLKAARDWDKDKKDYVVGTDDYGFAALPAAVSHVNTNGVRSFSNNGAFFWTATEKNDAKALMFVMHYEKESVESGAFPKDTWLSVRCIKD
ncbi:fibrobacter succinogenes major paralogous domain-containing protein [Fibrobacter sp. UBA4309]|uniref:fibrobacter succinogenes major paralogous domain-containing protein n=1 Tax=Fibrobacter sp. UBA4309 TaxID=1946537 RepID=UPI0025C57710|nr:fibrobacter succinogenes major paralogous domain-containing protein [Fibrobacter sp. UBA4309]